MKRSKLETAGNNDQSCKVNWWQQGRTRNTTTEGKTEMKATEGKRYGQPTQQPAHASKAQHRLFSSSKHMTFTGKKIHLEKYEVLLDIKRKENLIEN